MKKWRIQLLVIALASFILASCAADTESVPIHTDTAISSEGQQVQHEGSQDAPVLQTESPTEGDAQQESFPETEAEEVPEPEVDTLPSKDADPLQEEDDTNSEPVHPETGKPSELDPEPLEEGKLEITSAFPFTGINPDRNWEECENAASIRVRNVSEEYLLEADILVTYTDGTQISFRVTELPAGKSAMAFCLNGETIDVDAAIDEIQSDAEFTLLPDLEEVSASAEGTTITVTNHSGKDLEHIKVYCRNAYGEDSLGGIAYCYEIDTLPAQDVVIIEAIDCILGEAEIVRIEYNH